MATFIDLMSVGSHLIEALLLRGYTSVTCLSRKNSSLKKLPKRLSLKKTDYTKENLTTQLKECDILVHLAGRRLTPTDLPDMIYPFVNDSAEKLDNILYACKENNIKRIITASSIGVYSDANSAPYTELDQPKPATLYGLTKLFSEQRVDYYARKYNTSVAHVRLAQCYGYGEKNTPALMKFIEKAINKETIVLDNGGQYPIDEIYIDDALDAFIKLIETDNRGSFNIGAGKGYSVLEIAETINKVFGNEGNLSILPIKDKILSKHMDINKAKLELKWEPNVSLKNGLKLIEKQYKLAKGIK